MRIRLYDGIDAPSVGRVDDIVGISFFPMVENAMRTESGDKRFSFGIACGAEYDGASPACELNG